MFYVKNHLARATVNMVKDQLGTAFVKPQRENKVIYCQIYWIQYFQFPAAYDLSAICPNE